ncbi:MAG: OmpA family protein [Thiobacillaceae bacterium]
MLENVKQTTQGYHPVPNEATFAEVVYNARLHWSLKSIDWVLAIMPRQDDLTNSHKNRAYSTTGAFSNMRTTPLVFGVLGVALISAVAISAQAAEGHYYDPTNAASKEGKTIGYELFKTIGCPGKGLLDAPCKEPKPVDSDGDGVPDSLDKCPNTPAGVKVDAQGCPLDSDGDGVPDYLDKCPNTPAGAKVDAQGCPLPVAQAAPVPAPAPKKLVLEGVNFDNDKATLHPEALATLDRAAVALKEWGDVKVEIAGYTDSRSTNQHNMKLSQRRAEAVRDYLISKGVDADRLTAKGYGDSRPIADNDTEEGRLKNRRVELVPQQ